MEGRDTNMNKIHCFQNASRSWEIFEAGETNQTKRSTSELHPMS